jgi:hypothetical protein
MLLQRISRGGVFPKRRLRRNERPSWRGDVLSAGVRLIRPNCLVPSPASHANLRISARAAGTNCSAEEGDGSDAAWRRRSSSTVPAANARPASTIRKRRAERLANWRED